MKGLRKIIIITAVVIVALVAAWDYAAKKMAIMDILNEPVYMNIQLDSREYGGKSSWNFHYAYTVDDRQYGGWRNFRSRSGVRVGQTFTIAYAKYNPSNHLLLATPDDFEEMELPFPDSLYWLQDE